jgi:phosphomannomutase/phosphoglucomutase
LLFALAAGLIVWMGKEEAYGLHALKSCSGVLARELNDRVTSIQRRLRELAADPHLREALRGGDSEDLLARELSLASSIPDALKVRLVDPGLDAGEGAQSDSLSYAGLDLVHQAQRQREVTLLEVHRLGSPDEHLAVAAPVLAEDESVLGILHLSLPSSLLPGTDGAGGLSGRILLQQRVGDQVANLVDMQGESVPSGLPDYQTPIPGTRLWVVAWLSEGGAPDSRLLLFAGISYFTLLALFALALWVPLRGLNRALAMDHAGVVALVEDAVSGKPIRQRQPGLAETKPVIDVLIGLLRGLQSVNGDSSRATQDAPVTAARRAMAPGMQEQTDSGDKKTDEGIADSSRAIEGTPRPESVPADIFRAYDIRGIVDLDLTPELVHQIGRAVGSEVRETGNQTVVVGRDTRFSGVELSESLVQGLRSSGCDVLDLGVVPTPLVYFATCYQGETSGVVVTASHNPVSYNGLKVVINGASLAGDQIKALRERILAGKFSSGDGGYRSGDLVAEYVCQVEKDVAIARTQKVVIDCGNATAAVVAPQLYRALGCDLFEVNCNPEAGFPDGRVPDPTHPEHLGALQHAVVAQGADLGLAFDGDGDRLGVVDSSGKIIWPDRVLMLLAADVLSRHPGMDVVFDVKSSHHLAAEILRNGGRPVMWKSGHAPLKAKLRETGALLAGEWSGHIIFRERWYGFDDALYSGARLLEVLALDPRPSAEVFAGLPEAIGTPELFLHLAEGESAPIMAKVLEYADRLRGMSLCTLDGLRAEMPTGWGLLRASNTQPALVFRFEADNEAELAKIQDLFRGIMGSAAPELQLPF